MPSLGLIYVTFFCALVVSALSNPFQNPWAGQAHGPLRIRDAVKANWDWLVARDGSGQSSSQSDSQSDSKSESKSGSQSKSGSKSDSQSNSDSIPAASQVNSQSKSNSVNSVSASATDSESFIDVGATPTSKSGATSDSTQTSDSNSKTDSNSKSDSKETSKSSKSSKSTSSYDYDITTSIDARLPAGGITMLTPNPTDTTYIKIGQPATFSWSYTSLSVTPRYVNFEAYCSYNSLTYTLATNHPAMETSMIWDTAAFQANATIPLITSEYKLYIYDARANVTAVAGAGYLGVYAQKFAVYSPQAYTPLSEWTCYNCKDNAGGQRLLDPLVAKFLLGIIVIVVGSAVQTIVS